MSNRIKVGSAILLMMISAGAASARQTPSQPAQDVDSQIESVRADLRADKVTIIAQAMNFTAEESSAFWPIYKKYEAALSRLNDERVQLIKTYADKYTTLTDADAKQMAEKSFDLEALRVALKKQYYAEFNQKLSSTTVTKFFQLENRLDLIVNFKLASELPMLLDKPPKATDTATAK